MECAEKIIYDTLGSAPEYSYSKSRMPFLCSAKIVFFYTPPHKNEYLIKKYATNPLLFLRFQQAIADDAAQNRGQEDTNLGLIMILGRIESQHRNEH